MAQQKKGKLISLCGLWKRDGGKKGLTGKFGNTVPALEGVFVFLGQNNFKESAKQPDYVLSISEDDLSKFGGTEADDLKDRVKKAFDDTDDLPF